MGQNRRISLATVALIAIAACGLATRSLADPGTLRVQVDQPGVKISPSLYGIFFEEINNAGDGGLYAELLRNRSFEEPGKGVPNWSTLVWPGVGGSVDVRTGDASRSPFNTHHLTITADAFPPANADGYRGRIGVANDGYWGVNVTRDATYKLVVRAKGVGHAGGPAPKLIATIENRAGTRYAGTSIDLAQDGAGGDGATMTLTSAGTDPNARLVLALAEPGSVDIDYVSLMPVDDFNGQPFRKDLAQKLVDLKPSFMRFPGGCWVEGETMATATRWKRTIGPVQERWTQQNLWGYYSPNGLGFYEYLQLCEDVGASAMFVVNVGMSHKEVVPMDKMDEYVQDALDGIEYAIGPVDSVWGKKRAEAGHPAPFKLDYVEIGNENGGRAYNERYALYYDAIKKKYPQIKTIACFWQGNVPKTRPVELLDEHYYESPQFFFRNVGKYDKYDRNGPHVYVGEYAVTKGCGLGNLIAALGEAAFMTGMERNSDIVSMASYAPLFTQVNGRRWNPNLINFDNVRSYGTPSYHVQQMFSTNRGDTVLPVTMTLAAPETSAPDAKLSGRAGVGTWGTQAEYKDFEVVAGDKVVYRAADGKRADWKFIGKGLWEIANDGSLAQTSNVTDVQAIAGDPAWADYSVRVKARKTGGNEGFIVVARHQGEGDYVWLNVGGWGNTATGIERNRDGDKTEISPRSAFRVENNRWYDLRLDVKGDQVTAFIDGVQVAAAKDTAGQATAMLAATASRDAASGDVIVKFVNGTANPQAFKLDIAGANASGPAKAIVLAGNPDDENSPDAPMRVAPRTETFDVGGTTLARTFPAYSLTILRIPTR